MTFALFCRIVSENGLEPQDHGNGHWQIKGGHFIVNFYPHAKTGPTAYVNGTNRRLILSGHSLEHHIRAAVELTLGKPVLQTFEPEKRKPTKWARRKRERLLKKTQVCAWCGKPLTLDTSTLDHIIPLARGGTNATDNLCLACYGCNQDRGSDMPELRRTKS